MIKREEEKAMTLEYLNLIKTIQTENEKMRKTKETLRKRKVQRRGNCSQLRVVHLPC